MDGRGTALAGKPKQTTSEKPTSPSLLDEGNVFFLTTQHSTAQHIITDQPELAEYSTHLQQLL
jgi:hypothetical protein